MDRLRDEGWMEQGKLDQGWQLRLLTMEIVGFGGLRIEVVERKGQGLALSKLGEVYPEYRGCVNAEGAVVVAPVFPAFKSISA